MDLRQLEYAAELVFRMCRENPELCPHDYEWVGSTIIHNTGHKEDRYKCKICGHAYTNIVSSEEVL